MSDTVLNYKLLASQWHPGGDVDSLFKKTAIATVTLFLLIALFVSSIQLPEEERRAQPVVPERVAKFILEQEKPKPKPKIEPKPLPKPVPKILKKAPEKREPLTEAEKTARKKAEQTGVLALANELSDLIDTSSINNMVGVKTKRSTASSTKAASYDQPLFADESGRGSSGVDAARYTAHTGGAKLSEREVTLVKQVLIAGKTDTKDTASQGKQSRGVTGRSEEELTIVFDRNKGSLYSVYNRARRKNPGLKGKIILEITIAPGGTVTRVRIVSSELGDKELEQNLLRRIKTFQFEAKNVESITVTYPIEFLPS